MKKSAIAFALICALLLSACSSGGASQIPNPMTEVSSASEFESLGFSIDAPEDASDVKYFTISGEIAQVSFSLNGAQFTYRASKSSDDISGVYGEFEDLALGVEVELVNNPCSTIDIKTLKEGGRLAHWSISDVNFSLYTPDDITDDVATTLTASLAGNAVIG